jgi:hypothetical protein
MDSGGRLPGQRRSIPFEMDSAESVTSYVSTPRANCSVGTSHPNVESQRHIRKTHSTDTANQMVDDVCVKHTVRNRA